MSLTKWNFHRQRSSPRRDVLPDFSWRFLRSSGVLFVPPQVLSSLTARAGLLIRWHAITWLGRGWYVPRSWTTTRSHGQMAGCQGPIEQALRRIRGWPRDNNLRPGNGLDGAESEELRRHSRFAFLCKPFSPSGHFPCKRPTPTRIPTEAACFEAVAERGSASVVSAEPVPWHHHQRTTGPRPRHSRVQGPGRLDLLFHSPWGTSCGHNLAEASACQSLCPAGSSDALAPLWASPGTPCPWKSFPVIQSESTGTTGGRGPGTPTGQRIQADFP